MLSKISVNEQSSICIKADKSIYFDPFKVKAETHDADIVLITHAHFDHFSPEDIQKVAKADTLYVVPASMEADALKAGLPKEQLVLLKPGETCRISDISVEAVSSYNVGKPMHPKENGWLGYVVTLNDTRVYVCGDMDATPEAVAVQCDIVLVPVGGTYTMNAKEAAAFVNELKPQTAIPTHYGTLVGKPEDGEVFKQFVDEGIDVHFKL